MGKGENAGYQHFLLFPQCFQKASFSGLLKSGYCDKELSSLSEDKTLNQSKFEAFALNQKL